MPDKGTKQASADDTGGNIKRRRTSEEDGDDEPLIGGSSSSGGHNVGMSNRDALAAPERSHDLGLGCSGGGASSTASAPERQKERKSGDDSDEEDEAAKAKAMMLAAAASESDSDSSSEDSGAPKKADKAGEAGDKPAASAEASAEVAAEKAQGIVVEKKDDASSSSDSSSESSSSSSSSSASSEEEEDDELAMEPVSEATIRERRLATVRSAQLRRDEICKILLNLPEEDAETAIKKSYVRLTVKAQPSAKDACVLAQIAELEACTPYNVPVFGDRGVEPRQVTVQLKCQRGSASSKTIKITSVSNQDVTEQEFEQWQRLTTRTSGMEVDFFIEQMQQKAIDIVAARKFVFDDASISKVLKKKPPVVISAQKQTKMQFLVQCALSQMDISGIRDIEAEELEAKYQEALKGLHDAERESAEIQEDWFDKRPNLFALKMINERNAARQVRDDRHALEYALETEQNESGERNPFERRPCRPMMAWDTKLTGDVGGPKGDSKASSAKSKPAGDSAAPAQTTSHVNGSEAHGQPVTLDASTRMRRIMQAHKRADLLAKLGPIMTQVA